MGQCHTFLESDDLTDIILKCIEYKTMIKTVGNKNSFPSLGVACFYNFPLPDTSTPITRHQLMTLTLTLKWNILITLVNYVVCFLIKCLI